MLKRICWKKGMRLTDEILTAADDSTSELVSNALVLAAAGRFGLFPSSHPFEILVNFNKNMIDVESLNCLAITKGGNLIDAEYDTMYSNTFDTRVAIPNADEDEVFLLTINAQRNEWRDTNDGYCEPVYSFGLVPENSPLADCAMPIARIVNEYGWRMDEVDFVPPCLYVSSHRKFAELCGQFLDTLRLIDASAVKQMHSDGRNAIKIFWPIVQQLLITMEKEQDLMTPMMLFANVQKCVSSFLCACTLDEYLDLSDSELFQNYVRSPYNYKDVYKRIKEGLEFCVSINGKIEKFQEVNKVQPEKEKVVQPPKEEKRRPGWNGIKI
ncbi:hypothetical protein [Phocaeicola sp.]